MSRINYTFFPIPNDLVTNGLLARMSEAVLKVYMVILQKSNYKALDQYVELSNSVFEGLTGLSAPAIRDAVKLLEAPKDSDVVLGKNRLAKGKGLGLIEVIHTQGGRHL